MNWTDIKSTNPKAFAALLEWHQKEGDDMTTPLQDVSGNLMFRFTFNPKTIVEVFSKRELYDFFDHHKVIILLTHDWTMGFLPVIRSKDDSRISTLDDHPTRIEAEQAAFEKAFEILEKKLRQDG